MTQFDVQNHDTIQQNIRTSLKRQGRLWQQEEGPRAQPPRKWWRQRWKSPELQTSAPSCPNAPCSIILNENILKVSIFSTSSISRKKTWKTNPNKEKRELLNGIREIAIERLQLARLQGVYLQKSRNPVSLSFHFLHPHLFGKDLSLNNFSSTDSFDFNPEPNKRAGLMRQFVETSGNSAKIKIGGNFTNQSSDDFVYHKDPLKLFNDE